MTGHASAKCSMQLLAYRRLLLQIRNSTLGLALRDLEAAVEVAVVRQQEHLSPDLALR